MSKEEFVDQITSLDSKGKITTIQYIVESFGGADLLGSGNKSLTKEIQSFTKKYLKSGELLTEYKAEKGGKAETQLQKIMKIAKDSIDKSQYEQMYDSNFKSNYDKKHPKTTQ